MTIDSGKDFNIWATPGQELFRKRAYLATQDPAEPRKT